MKLRELSVAILVVTATSGLAWAAGEQQRVRWQGTMRNIAVYAPAAAGNESPLLLVMGDPGRSARYALESWRELAETEGFVVAAVSSENPQMWRTPQDGAGLLRAVVTHVKSRLPIDSRRIYLFGAAAAGGFALSLGAQQPGYFAAVASFDGEPQLVALQGSQLDRSLPVTIFFSKRTPLFEVDALRQAAEALRQSGAEVAVERLEIPSDFERKGRKAAARIWAALSPHALTDEPRFRSSRFGG